MSESPEISKKDLLKDLSEEIANSNLSPAEIILLKKKLLRQESKRNSRGGYYGAKFAMQLKADLDAGFFSESKDDKPKILFYPLAEFDWKLITLKLYITQAFAFLRENTEMDPDGKYRELWDRVRIKVYDDGIRIVEVKQTNPQGLKARILSPDEDNPNAVELADNGSGQFTRTAASLIEETSISPDWEKDLISWIESKDETTPFKRTGIEVAEEKLLQWKEFFEQSEDIAGAIGIDFVKAIKIQQ